MKLLDFPVELIRTIIETTVQDVGLCSSVRLREVFKTFDKEVMRSYETLSIFSFDKNTKIVCRDIESHWRGDWARCIIPFLARFIERRPYEASWESTVDGCELWQSSVPSLLNRILDDLNINAEDRFEALVRLLEFRNDRRRTGRKHESSFPGVIFELLEQRFLPGSEKPLFKHLWSHVFTGAILLKEQQQTSEMWANRPLSAKCGEIFWAAIKARQFDLATSQIQPASPPSSHSIWTDVILASVETADTDTAQQFLRLAWEEGAASRGRLETALIRCAALCDSNMAKLLIDIAMENGADSRRFGDGFREALFRSTLFGDITFIELLYSHRGSLDLLDLTTGDYSVRPICVAAWTGRIEVLQWFLDQGNDLRQGHILSAFAAAIQGDKVESLRCLIEGLFDGADDLEDGYWNWPSQIIDGLHLRNYRSVRYLLEEAMVIASPEDYEKVLSMVVMGGHIEVLEGLIRSGVPMDEPLLTQNDNNWTPIMYAHASAEPGARLIEQRLYQLGIEPVDMTKAQYLEDFERQRNQTVPSYTPKMPFSVRLRSTKQETAKDVIYINGPRQVNCGHDVDH